MTRVRPFFYAIVSLSVLAAALPARAADSPLAVLRAATERARAVLQDPTYQGPDRREARVERVKEILLPQFDPPEIVKRTLGPYWRERTEAQKKEFTQLFIQLLEKTYSGMLDRYNAGVQFFYDQERIEGDFAEVDTRIFDPVQNRTFSIGYHMHRVDGKWLIYDIVAENVSLVQNYRNQFNRILSKSSYEDLVQTIQAKLKQLSTPSPS
ncbi:MAG TPA: ABC transporter substrate-binding protein [Candidatus Binatia bacterium]|nr:ABC transporter substrate-binding protein [Candidatus Binatia bacterium]